MTFWLKSLVVHYKRSTNIQLIFSLSAIHHSPSPTADHKTHQRPSFEHKSHQRPPFDHKTHQRPSFEHKIHQRRSFDHNTDQRPTRLMSDPHSTSRQSTTYRRHKTYHRPSFDLKAHQRPSIDLKTHQRPTGDHKIHQRPSFDLNDKIYHLSKTPIQRPSVKEIHRLPSATQ